MFCPKCGAQLPEGAAFCGYCGTSMGAQQSQDHNAAQQTNSIAVQQQGFNANQQTNHSAAQQTNPHAKPSAKRGKGPLIAVAAVVVAALAIVGVGFALGWFGGQSGPGVSGGATGGASGGVQGGTDPVYVVSNYHYYNTSGTYGFVASYDRDENGNTVEDDYKQYEYDEYGNKVTEALLESPEKTTNYYNELDENHRLVHQENSDGQFTYDCEYYENGTLKKSTWVLRGDRRVTEYDENGYIITWHQVRDDNGAVEDSKYSYEWEFDSKGNPVSCTQNSTITEKDGTTTTKSATRTYECDEHGNVVKTYKDGGLIREYEYVKVDNPSVAVCVEASTHNFM